MRKVYHKYGHTYLMGLYGLAKFCFDPAPNLKCQADDTDVGHELIPSESI